MDQYQRRRVSLSLTDHKQEVTGSNANLPLHQFGGDEDLIQ